MSQFSTFFISHGDDGSSLGLLNQLLRSKRVIQVDKQVFPNGWAFCVEWLENSIRTAEQDFIRPNGKIDYRNVLDANSFARFAKLRERRKAIAEEDGVKPYVVMTDAQLAELAKMELPTLASLKTISGVGESRSKMYGPRLLAANEEPAEKSDSEKKA